MAPMPRTTTVASTHTSGNDGDDEREPDEERREIVLDLAARARGLEGRRGGGTLGGVEAGRSHQPFTFPPATTRAIALTTKVRMNRTRPAAMYAPVGSGWLNSEAADAMSEANV